MSSALRPARLDWSQGIPWATDFGDLYFSRDDGAAESRHVFLTQNRLAERFSALAAGDNFTIIETGFGTGLNWLVTQALWRQSSTSRPSPGSGWLHYVSVEKHPLSASDLARAQAHWPEHQPAASALQQRYPVMVPGFHRLVFPEWRSTLTLFFGDVTDFLPRLSARADAWFLDGFAPDRNPGMWNGTVYTGMAALSHEGTSFATFTAAGHVRRGLEAAGFRAEKVQGHGSKRDMLCGEFTGAEKIRHSKPWLYRPTSAARERKACVIGAGIAGSSTAARLALRGWQVTVLEAGSAPAQGASGNPAAIIYPRLAGKDEALDHFPQQAWLFVQQELQALTREDSAWHPCGVLQLLTGNQQREREKIISAELPETLVNFLDAETASAKAGVALADEAACYATAGWLQPTDWCNHLLSQRGITVKTQSTAVTLEHRDGLWQCRNAQGELLDESPVVIVANSLSARALAQTAQLPLQAVGGQISGMASSPLSAGLKTVICHDGYLTPVLPDGLHCLGATFHPGDESTHVTTEDHEENRRQLHEVLPALADSLPETATWTGRKSLRCQSADYLPLLGPVTAIEDFQSNYAGLRNGKVQDYPPLNALPGLYVNLAHGSKGFTQAALAAEILASEISGEPAPVSRKVLDALHPLRFWERQLKRGA
jgi:tRNA 5-methylaminomethyl-2-thiouridine biosynthesis bifunctional protein